MLFVAMIGGGTTGSLTNGVKNTVWPVGNAGVPAGNVGGDGILIGGDGGADEGITPGIGIVLAGCQGKYG